MTGTRDGMARGCQGRYLAAMRHAAPWIAPLLFLGLALASGGCTANPDVTPSPLPPGYRPRPPGAAQAARRELESGEEVDVKLAVVEGEVITRRRLERQVGGLGQEQDPASLERQIRQALLQRARLLVFTKAAIRAGVTVSDQKLDEVVADALEGRLREAADLTGRPVSETEYLAEQGQTREEFRAQVKEELLYRAYTIRILRGFGEVVRPQVDMEVSPAEVRRIYWSHPGAFDEKPAVRFVAFQLGVERYLVGDVGFLDAEEKAAADADAIVQALRSGTPPESIAQRFELGEGEWRASEPDEFQDQGGKIRLLGPEANQWLFDPVRRRGDATVLPSDMGPVVVGLLERRAGRRMSFEDAYDDIVQLVRTVRQRRLEEENLIQILSTRNVVQPAELASALVAEARKTLGQIDEDPVLAAARFR